MLKPPEEWARYIFKRAEHRDYTELAECSEFIQLVETALRAYAEQEVAKAVDICQGDELAIAKRENELHDKKDAEIIVLRAERDALLNHFAAVTRAAQELARAVTLRCIPVGMLIEERPTNRELLERVDKLNAAFAHPAVHRLLKAPHDT